jgi:hypothetical protein
MAEDIGSVLIYGAPRHSSPPDKRELIFGVDVGIRNLGVVVIASNRHSKSQDDFELLGIHHEDLGGAANDDEEILIYRLRERLRGIFQAYYYANVQRDYEGVMLSIETQEKQRGDCQMAQIAGMIKMCFFDAWHLNLPCSIYSSSPSACSSLAVQRLCLPEDECSAVSGTEAKKPKVVQMLEGLLLKRSLLGPLRLYREKLCRFTAKGLPIKSQDRRDHTGDALGHALKAHLEKSGSRKRKRE